MFADAFERERVDFLQRLDEMSGNSSAKHSLKWDLHKKDEQVMDLQKALSDAHVFLYEERAQVLKLTAENDRLKIQELEDRQRLEHLLALTQPINQEVTYFRECRPEKLSRNYPGARDDIYAGQKDMSTIEAALDSPRRQVLNTSGQAVPISNNSNLSMLSGGNQSQFGNTSMRASTARKTGGAAVSARRAGAGGAGGKGGAAALRPVVRTIYLPNENIDILKQIIASLRSQLTEQHTLFEQRIQALQEDRAIREQETAEVQRKAHGHIQELAAELKAVNDLNKMTTRDYLELRHAAQLNERKLKERASVLSQQQVDLAKHLKDVEGKAARNETELATENAQYVSMFRQQTAATEEDLAIMKAQYATTQDLYEKRIRYLEGRIATLKQKSDTRTAAATAAVIITQEESNLCRLHSTASHLVLLSLSPSAICSEFAQWRSVVRSSWRATRPTFPSCARSCASSSMHSLASKSASCRMSATREQRPPQALRRLRIVRASRHRMAMEVTRTGRARQRKEAPAAAAQRVLWLPPRSR